MEKINLSRAIRLQLDGDPVMLGHGLQGVRDLPAGVQEVEPEIADHWFVKAHCIPVPETPVGEPAEPVVAPNLRKQKKDASPAEGQDDPAQ